MGRKLVDWKMEDLKGYWCQHAEKSQEKRTKKNYENLAESEDEEQQYGDEEFYEESHEMYEYGLKEESGINLMVPVSDDEDIDTHVDTL